jgi:hypothetical protein
MDTADHMPLTVFSKIKQSFAHAETQVNTPDSFALALLPWLWHDPDYGTV